MKNANQIGAFNIFRQAKPKKRWKDPNRPEYDPNWVVEFRLPGEPPKRESSRLPLCDKCLAEEKNPVETRADCRIANCLTDARRWAEARLAELGGQWKQGRIEPKRAVRSSRLMLVEVLTLYRAKGPEDKEEGARLFEQVITRTTGRPIETVAVDELIPAWWRDWARMYQEYARRGWTAKGKAPKDAWAQLRASLPSLPVLDYDTPSTANTTIRSVMAKVKSVVGPESRSRYLVDLEGRWPLASLEEWRKTKISVLTPDTTFQIAPEVYAKMHKDHPKEKARDLQLWLFLAILWQTGLRPGELVAATTDWLEVADIPATDKDGKPLPPTRQVYLVVKNRQGSFKLKSRRSKQECVWPLSPEVVEVIEKLAISGGSVLGLSAGVDEPEEGTDRRSRRASRAPEDRLRIAQDNLLRRASSWLRKCGVTGSHTNYNFRKLVGTVKAAKEGAGAVAVALGHTSEATGQRYYAGKSVPISPLSAVDLSTDRVVGTTRSPWNADSIASR